MDSDKKNCANYVFPVGKANDKTIKEKPKKQYANSKNEKLRSDVDFLLMLANEGVE